jgi:hypothetical protein
MSYRFFPRQSQSRNDLLAGPGHNHGPQHLRSELSRRDGYAQEIGAEGNNAFVNGTVAVTGAGSLGVKSIVAGGSALLFTLTSSQDRWRLPNADILAAVQAGLATGFNPGSIAYGLATTAFSVDATGLLLNVVLPAVAAYSPGAGTAYLWTFPKEAFKNSPVSIAVASALVVTSAA